METILLMLIATKMIRSIVTITIVIIVVIVIVVVVIIIAAVALAYICEPLIAAPRTLHRPRSAMRMQRAFVWGGCPIQEVQGFCGFRET